MRYLNKIVFINSADIKYAEVNLEGNVHFIGTQGVGKTTILRALLFFYNGDKLKLGITKEKKIFDEYYFPFQNSYIVFEVQTENGHYCVLVFKSQGRAAFRFFNSVFDKSFFIDNEGKAYENWDKIRDVFGKNIYYTRIIQSYEEYRDIIYGNNKELQNEFKKYAILESKQYQNIPRTITNVFLNTDLSAEFVKETIINSISEEYLKIDLTTYSQTHLKGFESNLNDIKKWTDKDKNGENSVEIQAKTTIDIYSDLKELDKKKTELSFQLSWALNNVKAEQPKFIGKLETENLKKTEVGENLKERDNIFEEKKKEIIQEIGKYKGKLVEIKEKRIEYETLKIETILERVSKKEDLEREEKNLLSEKEILTSKFLEVKQKFDALLNQLSHQRNEFEDNKQTEKSSNKENFLDSKEKISNEYELLFEDIRRQHKAEHEKINELIKEKTSIITERRIEFSEVENKRFFENEIKNCESEITTINNNISKAKNENIQATENIKSIETEWELKNSALKKDTCTKIEKQNDIQKLHSENIATIDNKIRNSKDSLYGWLNEQLPNWDKTIGKVIDEENVLFKTGLNPQKVSNEMNFYGIKIDADKISKTVKTVDDYENEKTELQNKIQSIQSTIATLNDQRIEGLEKLRQTFQPEIKDLKDKIQNNGDIVGKSQLGLEIVSVRLTELKNKAETEKKSALAKIEGYLATLDKEKRKLEEDARIIEAEQSKKIDTKKIEKENKLKNEQQKLTEILKTIDSKIESYKKEIHEKESEIKEEQKKNLKIKELIQIN